jgi:hypothetical protein
MYSRSSPPATNPSPALRGRRWREAPDEGPSYFQPFSPQPSPAKSGGGGRRSPGNGRGSLGPKALRPKRSNEPHHHRRRSGWSSIKVPGERLRLDGPKAFGFKRSNEPRHHPEPEPPVGRRMQSISVATLALERRLANPSWFALPSVSGFRLVPSEQAPRLRRALSREPRDPGLPSGRGRRIVCSSGARAQKNPPERRLGRVRRNGLSISYQKRSPSGVEFACPTSLGLFALDISLCSIMSKLGIRGGRIPNHGR